MSVLLSLPKYLADPVRHADEGRAFSPLDNPLNGSFGGERMLRTLSMTGLGELLRPAQRNVWPNARNQADAPARTRFIFRC